MISDDFSTDADDSTTGYEALHGSGEKLAVSISEAIVNPVAKQHFEMDRGHPVNQTLPDRSEEYEFESHGFSALILPDERRVVNQSYMGRGLTAGTASEAPEEWDDIGEAAEEMWWDTFGEWHHTASQPSHPGPFPLDADAISEGLQSLRELREQVLEDASLDVAIEAARERDFAFLAEMFGTTREDIYSPGGTDLSALRSADDVHVPYNDGKIAVLRPMSERRRPNEPVRGVIIGHDDTPVGIFAHVADVTNLSPSQQTTRDGIRDAMGFDREINPFNPPKDLDISGGERVRLQGDLRVERTGEVESFPDELARRTRINLYREAVEELFDGVELPDEHIRRRSSVSVSDVLDVNVTPDGTVSIDPSVSDGRVELLAYAQLMFSLEHAPVDGYDSYDDVEYIIDPATTFRQQMAVNTLHGALQQAREEVRSSLQNHLQRQRGDIEREARNTAAEAEAGIDVPRQVNLPIDNHMAFIEEGYAPDVETEPVPVAVPETTTLHIVHDEHNTITVQVSPGVYRFSLLPRGLQPPGDRPRWPSP